MTSNSKSSPQPACEMAGRRIADVGFALIDVRLESIALDEGAASILSAVSGDDLPDAGKARGLPPDIQKQIRAIGLPCSDGMRFIAGDQRYAIRSHTMQAIDGAAPGKWTVLRFERHVEASDALAELSATCGLTDREEEALRAIALGLTGKEVAERMNISLSTVKVFLHLIKIKTGARNRAAIVARLLRPMSGTSPDDRDRASHPQVATRSAP